MVECPGCGKEFEGHELPSKHVEECSELVPSPVYKKDDVKEKLEVAFGINVDESDEDYEMLYEEGFLMGWMEVIEFIEKYEEDLGDLEHAKNHLDVIRESFKGEF